jgi:hypothetical protein
MEQRWIVLENVYPVNDSEKRTIEMCNRVSWTRSPRRSRSDLSKRIWTTLRWQVSTVAATFSSLISGSGLAFCMVCTSLSIGRRSSEYLSRNRRSLGPAWRVDQIEPAAFSPLRCSSLPVKMWPKNLRATHLGLKNLVSPPAIPPPRNSDSTSIQSYWPGNVVRAHHECRRWDVMLLRAGEMWVVSPGTDN